MSTSGVELLWKLLLFPGLALVSIAHFKLLFMYGNYHEIREALFSDAPKWIRTVFWSGVLLTTAGALLLILNRG